MPESMSDHVQIEAWLQPLGGVDGPAGKDVEYDNDFLGLIKASNGVAETQFSPAEPPNWRLVREGTEALLDKSRDLRLAVLWTRAAVNLEGLVALAAGIALMEGLLSALWEHVHPLPDPDDGDTYARANALAVLPQPEGLWGDVRQSVLFNMRGVGELRVRHFEVALGHLAARPDEATLTRDQITQMLAAAHAQEPGLQLRLAAALAALDKLSTSAQQRLGAQGAPDLRVLQTLLKQVLGLFPHVAVEEDPAEAVADEQGLAPAAKAAGGARLAGQVQSREDAVRAIDMVCEYLERAEPSNPAQLLLRRSRRMINQNFLQLMKQLAPDALNEVARLMGVDPDSVEAEK